MMKRERITIDGRIPALVWGGEETGRLFVAVHGDRSHKADSAIEDFAAEAVAAGWRVLSYDLPEHGERAGGGEPCKAQICVAELRTVLDYARLLCERTGVFGVSMGAYFCLAALRDEPLEQCLFLSPVVDMHALLDKLLLWSGMDARRLEREGEVGAAMGKTLYWDDYCYVRDNPVARWSAPTSILCGERDEVSEPALVRDFAARSGCALDVMPGGEHFFHTAEQMAYLRQWVRGRLQQASE